MGKNSKIFSETKRPTALIFGMWQWLMVLYINCASHAPGVKFGYAPGFDSLHRLTTIRKPSNSPIGSLFLYLKASTLSRSGERLQDHWSSGILCVAQFLPTMPLGSKQAEAGGGSNGINYFLLLLLQNIITTTL